MLSRRQFFLTTAAPALIPGAAQLTSKERVDRALKGQDVDRSPFTFWHHFLDSDKPGEQHARSHLDFHRKFHTDLVKVMSDYTYPKPNGQWFEVKVDKNPFPRQVRALELIRDGLGGEAYFIETIFNPINQAEKISSKEAVEKLKHENPQKLLDALEAIGRSQASHAQRALAAGASGIFLAIANSVDADYAKFSEPFDKMILDAAAQAPINILHIHGNKIDLSHFYKGWPAVGINYESHATGIPLGTLRKNYSGVIMGGIDDVNYPKLTVEDLKRQHTDAMRAAGKRFILSPGCSVPNESTDEELLRLTRYLGA